MKLGSFPKPVKLLRLDVTQAEPQALLLNIYGRLRGFGGGGGLSRPHYFDWMHNIYMHQDGLTIHRDEGEKANIYSVLVHTLKHQQPLLSFTEEVETQRSA